ncbi:MAG: glycosyltransferase family 4 protein [Candidatus Methanospirareceae archaeon]
MVEKILWLSEMLRVDRVGQDGTVYVVPGMSGYARASMDIVVRLLERNFNISVADWGLHVDTAFETPKKNVICRVYGVATKEEVFGRMVPTFGRERIEEVLKMVKPGLLIVMGDYRMIEYLRDVKNLPSTIYVHPLDFAPLPEEWIETLEYFDEIVAISRFGEEEMKKAGLRNVHYIPLGVDTNAFHPLDESMVIQTKLRNGFDGDSFIFGCVGVNIARKNWPAVIEAFAKFNKAKPKAAWLYMHTYPLPEAGVGYHLFKLVERFAKKYEVQDLLDRSIFGLQGVMAPSVIQQAPSEEEEMKVSLQDVPKRLNTFESSQERGMNIQKSQETRKKPISMNTIYNIFDCNLLFSQEEGFGLTVAESMAAGIPQIVANHTSLTELVGGDLKCGELVKVKTEVIEPQAGYMLTRYFIDVDNAVEKMVKMYENPGLRVKYGENARKKVEKLYDVEKVVIPKWVELINSF